MFIKLDKNNMELQVLCGILEKYEPNDDIRDIHSKVAELKEIMAKFMEKIVEPKLFAINKKISDENDKHIAKE